MVHAVRLLIVAESVTGKEGTAMKFDGSRKKASPLLKESDAAGMPRPVARLCAWLAVAPDCTT